MKTYDGQCFFNEEPDPRREKMERMGLTLSVEEAIAELDALGLKFQTFEVSGEGRAGPPAWTDDIADE